MSSTTKSLREILASSSYRHPHAVSIYLSDLQDLISTMSECGDVRIEKSTQSGKKCYAIEELREQYGEDVSDISVIMEAPPAEGSSGKFHLDVSFGDVSTYITWYWHPTPEQSLCVLFTCDAVCRMPRTRPMLRAALACVIVFVVLALIFTAIVNAYSLDLTMFTFALAISPLVTLTVVSKVNPDRARIRLVHKHAITKEKKDMLKKAIIAIVIAGVSAYLGKHLT